VPPGKGDNALLAALSPAERRMLADLLRKLVVAADLGACATDPSSYSPKRSRSDEI
jgi:hypothetical protein